LKGGKLPKEKLKLQLQKIATSRTGGMKTDEALGKTGGGPEGLPHSIIVTAEGVEGDVDLANQVEADAATATEPVDPDLLQEMETPANPPKEKAGKRTAARDKPAKSSKGKTAQMALFSETQQKKPAGKPVRPSKTSAPRGKK
jgi:DNA topoisomerase-6 subunit B